jgi:hypothetical protein
LLPLFVEFFTNELDLSVADRATIAISKLSNQDFHPHDFEKIKEWWQTHQNEFTNWPTSEFWDGVNQINSHQYREAAKSFDTVLQVDPTADTSRAFAIACDWEIGETNKAITLAKEFKNPDARWAKWATAKAELESGIVSNATVQLVFITTNFPTMIALPKQGWDMWRKVDWQLFNKLTTTTKIPRQTSRDKPH